MLNTTRKFIRLPHLKNKTGLSRTTVYTRINDELLPPAISLGDRAVGWIEHEVDEVIAAMIAGKSKKEIRALVKSLVDQRQQQQQQQQQLGEQQ